MEVTADPRSPSALEAVAAEPSTAGVAAEPPSKRAPTPSKTPPAAAVAAEPKPPTTEVAAEPASPTRVVAADSTPPTREVTSGAASPAMEVAADAASPAREVTAAPASPTSVVAAASIPPTADVAAASPSPTRDVATETAETMMLLGTEEPSTMPSTIEVAADSTPLRMEVAAAPASLTTELIVVVVWVSSKRSPAMDVTADPAPLTRDATGVATGASVGRPVRRSRRSAVAVERPSRIPETAVEAASRMEPSSEAVEVGGEVARLGTSVGKDPGSCERRLAMGLVMSERTGDIDEPSVALGSSSLSPSRGAIRVGTDGKLTSTVTLTGPTVTPRSAPTSCVADGEVSRPKDAVARTVATSGRSAESVAPTLAEASRPVMLAAIPASTVALAARMSVVSVGKEGRSAERETFRSASMEVGSALDVAAAASVPNTDVEV